MIEIVNEHSGGHIKASGEAEEGRESRHAVAALDDGSEGGVQASRDPEGRWQR